MPLPAAKMHAARLKMEATGSKAAAEPTASLYVGCSGWRYWDWWNSFYGGVPQPDWFKQYLKRFVPSKSTHRSTHDLRWRTFRRGSAGSPKRDLSIQ
jgi:hypothetical protein